MTSSEPERRVSTPWTGGLFAAVLGIYIAFFTPIQILLPLQLDAISGQDKVAALAWVTGLGALVSVVANPLAGALSDRTTSRFGRRHPWTVGGVLIGAAAVATLGAQSSVIGIAALWCVAQAGLNAAYASVNAAVPDHVPIRQRAVVSAWIGIPQPLGTVVGAVVVTTVVTGVLAGYLATATLAVVLVLPFALATPDPPIARIERPPWSWRGFWAGFWISPRRHPDFAWAWITRFLVMLGNSTGTLYLLYFLQDAVKYGKVFPGHGAAEGVLILTVVYTLGVVSTAVIGGVISDRLGRRKSMVTFSSLVMALAAALLALWPTWMVSIVAAAILGGGFGVYLAVDQALITQVLPKAGDRAKDLGVINIANSAPQVLGPAIAAPIVASIGGYTGLYLLTAALTIAGGVLVWKIRSVA